MFTLSESQRSWLTHKLDQAEASFNLQLQRLNESAVTPGETVHQLTWCAGLLASSDLLRSNLRHAIRLADNPEFEVTLSGLAEWYLQAILHWTPEHSTNPVANLLAELKHESQQEMLKILRATEDRGWSPRL